MVAMLLGAFFYGYMVIQLLTGWMANVFGEKVVLMTGMTMLTLATMACPVAARTTPWMLFAMRVWQGENLIYGLLL